jgi:polysaccharide export outer membrane protein
MTSLRCALLSICLVPALAAGVAQQTVNKPAPSAKPAAAPAINHPATSSSSVRPTTAASPAARPSNVASNYIIGAEDTLQITVWQEPNLSTPALPVRPDGKVSLPLVGDIIAAGFTPMQLATDIGNRLKQYVTDPVVDVSVLAVNSKRVYLIGEVMHVGPLAISPGMTVLQAIATAGGLTPYANKKHIYILRGDRQQKVPFDYTLAVKKGDMQGVSLVPGDTIVVP